MLEIIKLKNPFDRTRRETERVIFIPGQVLTEYVSEQEVEFVLNGNFVEQPELTYPADGDQVIVMPHVGGGAFKRIIGVVASMWLMGFAGKVISGVAGLGIKGYTLGAYLAAGAVMYVGGRIINAVVPTQQNMFDTSSSSQTYGWDTPQPITGEGGMVGITYGECIPAPQVLERHVETINGKQYLNLLLCGGMGPVDSISDIKIGSTPIGNFQEVQMETRLGTNDQEPISFFTDTPLDQAVGLEITESGLIQTSDSKNATALEVTVEFPGGLYYVNDGGGFSNATVRLSLYYRKAGTTVWKGFSSGIKSSSIPNATCSPDAPAETWTIAYTYDSVTEVFKFSVTGSVSGVQKDATLGVPYDNGFIQFVITRARGFTSYRKQTIIIEDGSFLVTANQNTAVRQSKRINGLVADQYDVKVIVASRDTGSRYCNSVTWSVLTAYNPGKYARPNKVLVGVRILATNQLSGSIPNITWRHIRSTVYVWNPEKEQYETRSARNPIWAAYDIYHQCRYLKNINTGLYEYAVFGVPHTRLDPHWDEWVEAAAYSDDQVVGLDGKLENRFEFDAFYDTVKKRHDAAQLAANVGHTVIMPRGNNIGIKCDKPGQIVQIFGEGRTTMSSLSGTFSATEDRALAVEIIYSDTNNDFKNTPFLVRSPKWSTSVNVQDNPAQLQLFGVKRKSQAYREGMYTLANNELVTQFIDIGTDIDAIVCSYGDIVGLNHSVSQMGIASGRIISATTNTVQLDKTVTLSASLTYQIILQLSDDSLVTRNIVAVSADNDTDTLTVSEPFAVIPQQFDNYVFGEYGKAVKPFRLVGVEKDGDLRCKLNLAEYVEGVYSGDLNYPIIDYTPPNNKLYDVSNLILKEENYRAKDGTNVSLLHISWNLERGQSADEFLVYYAEDKINWKLWGSTANVIETITNVSPLRTYYIKVCAAAGGMQSPGVTSSIYLTGKDAPPSDVPSLTATIDPTDSTKINLSWPAVMDIDLRGYRLMEGSTILTPTPILDTRYTYAATSSRQHTFSVVAIDNSGNPSSVPATITINITIEPAQVAGFSAVIQDTDRSRLNLSWQANSEQDISYYEIRVGDDWEHSTLIATQLKANTYTHVLTTEGSQNFMVKAVNVAGNQSKQSVGKRLQIILRPDTPTNLKAAQEPRDRSMVKVTWTASPGKDIAGYELRYGNDWDSGTLINIVKESTFWWYIPSSGTYNIMVQARTVAGYVSNIANVSITAMIEAYDVTGFGAIQLLTDRTKIRLSWDQPLSLDVAYFEIRKGTTWDTGIVVGQRVTGTYYDVIVTEEIAQTFWIKAVTVAGNYSQNPAKVSDIFNMNPDPVTNIKISQDMNDKSVVIITWTGISESDLTGYQVKIGYVWDTAIALPLTQELKTTYSPLATGDLKVMIKSVNAAGFYSDESSNHDYITLEPSDVAGLTIYQNGTTAELYWDAAIEPDVTAYEIREGANFDQGSLVANGVTQNKFIASVDTERVYQYFIKAINRSGHYSLRAAKKNVSIVNLPVRNVIEDFDEILLANGTHSNTEFGQSLLNWQTLGGSFPDYPTTKFSDIGGSSVLKLLKQQDGTYPLNGVYVCQRIDVGQIITANLATRFISTVILRGTGSARLQIRTSQNGTDFTAWQDFKPVQFTFRYADFQVLLGTSDTTKTPEVNQFLISIDVPDFPFHKTVTIPVGGATVEYGHTYYTLPILSPTAIGEGLHPDLISKSYSSCVVKIKNSSNIDVGGQLDLSGNGF